MGYNPLVILVTGWWLLQGALCASSPLCSTTSSGGQACKVYKVEDCQNLVDIPLLREVHCPAAFNGVQDILKVVSLKSHAPHYEGLMEFYVDDITLARSNNTCKENSHDVLDGRNMSTTPGDAVCHLLTTVTSPGAKATWWLGALRPLPSIIEKLLAARPTSIMTFGWMSPSWNILINQMGISIEFRYIVDSMVDAMKRIFLSIFTSTSNKSKFVNHVALTADGGGGWGGGIFLPNAEKVVDFGGGGGGGVTITSQGEKDVRADGGAESTVQEHKSYKDEHYFPTLGLSGRSNGMDIRPTYSYKRDSIQNGYKNNVTTACYDKDILGEYLISIQDVYQELKEMYSSGGTFTIQGGGGQGAGFQVALPDGNGGTFSTGSGFMFDYTFYNPNDVRKVRLLADPYDNLYKELGRIYQEATDYAAMVCANNADPMCECQARYEYVIKEAKQYADPLPSWITTNTCQTGSSTDADSCHWIKANP